MIDNQRRAGAAGHPAPPTETNGPPKRTHRARRLLLSLMMVIGIATAGCTPAQLEANLGTGGFLEQSFEDAFAGGAGLEGALFQATRAADVIILALQMRLGSFGP